ncbi:GyrI-like domain-containing protein [Staphylococcus aureus]|uniref:GyrI-like domain-containing protein n=1 Tax=Staphylococcus aureus TaxID=1280 RepID=UPI003F5B15D7
MEYQLQQLASLTLVGIKETYENGRQAQQHIAGFWQRCYQEGVIADLQLKNNGDLAGILGLCISELDGKMSYMIAVTGDNSADIEKYDVITLASSKYMVFEAQGAVPKAVQQKMEEVHHYIHQYQADTVKSAPFFELYQDGDTTSEKYITVIWMPVKG